MAVLIRDPLKSAKYEIKLLISSDLIFVSNILSSLTIIHAGKRDQGYKCFLSF